MTGQTPIQITKAPKTFKSLELVNGKRIIINTNGFSYPFSDVHELFSFLIEELSGEESAFVWNLDEFLAPILRKIDSKSLTHLWEANRLYYAPFQIFYIPNKVFTIRHVSIPNSKKSFYSLNQYFKDISTEPTDIQFYSKVLTTNLNSIGLYPTKFTSPIKIYETCIMKYLNLPHLANIHKEVVEFAEECTGKLWIEAYQLGYWKEAFDYDIESAFPAATKMLVDIRNGKWVKYYRYQPSAYYGYLRGTVRIYENIKVHPIMCKKKSDRDKNSWFTPTGKWKTTITKEEYEFIYNHQIGTFEIDEAWWFFPQYLSFPLLVPMNKVLKWKESESWVIREFAKGVSVGIYGKFLEKHKNSGVGEYFNPVYGAEISTPPKLFIAEQIYKHNLQDHLLHISVDGFKLDKEINL